MVLNETFLRGFMKFNDRTSHFLFYETESVDNPSQIEPYVANLIIWGNDNFSDSERKVNLFKYLGFFPRRDAIPDQYYEDSEAPENPGSLNSSKF